MSQKEPVAAKSLASLQTLGPTQPVGARSLADVVLVNGAQLWANPHYDHYRDAWRAAFPASPIPPGYDVDHVYSKERAKQQGYRYVRLALVPAGPNRSAGAGWEKAVLQLETERRGIPDLRKMDLVQLTKVLGIRVGPKSGGYPGVRL